MNPLKQIGKHGQSIWLDYIRRSLMESGELKRFVEEDGLRGVTSNPSIFQKAITGGDEYDDQLREVLEENPQIDTVDLYETIAIRDIQNAADVLRPVYDETEGKDGFVSLEVSPHLAYKTEETIAEARRLWGAVGRPNVMIKVPATEEGLPAIERLVSEGININVTLMFSLSHYERVAHAYLCGVEKAEEPGRVASVASCFISRVDKRIDAELNDHGSDDAMALRGRIAIANIKVIYQRFKEIFAGEDFESLQAKGARVQRPLWASTGTKNPDYPDVLYVEELIGPETVNTMPPPTYNAFRDHGEVRGVTVEEGLTGARAALDKLADIGIDLNKVCDELQREGVDKFIQPFDELIEALDKKRKEISGTALNDLSLELGETEGAVENRVGEWCSANIPCRLWERDSTIWFSEPQPEITNRLGWLDLPQAMHDEIDDLQAFAGDVRSDGMAYVVLLGMGGSSLAPEVYARTFGSAEGYPQLLVLDSTHPDAVEEVARHIEMDKTLFVVSSKSGTTLETLSFMRYFWDKVSQSGSEPGRQFIAITDPNTPLEDEARNRNFRRVFRATPDLGGRFSALSVFGLVPGVLIGMDCRQLLGKAWTLAESCAFCVPGKKNPSLYLGAALGELTRAGKDKLTVTTSPSLSAFPDWLEQLIAESTGKEGTGIVPVVGEPLATPDVYSDDRVFVHLSLADEQQDEVQERLGALAGAGHPVITIQLPDVYAIGQEMFRWEMAVSLAGAALGIHPFNQPNVELAKKLAKDAMKAGEDGPQKDIETIRVSDRAQVKEAVSDWLANVKAHDYVSIQAYLAPSDSLNELLQDIRLEIRDKHHVATTVGYGPRFLHSTGQLHKGGPATGHFLQLVDEPVEKVSVPETDYSFAGLIQAQASGDYQALKQEGRRVIRVDLGQQSSASLKKLAETTD